ncbi:hypothetical protein M9H77_13242 [Catharanthus roseus]|uniref:Uncharacterized protein n=1 Tax=Catharanthus roseus TaxID=4058 RepID=A0ACC0BJX9_CATRO|nr:hypothetical protein M9H77_13242 [Catharanthus roseus]
MKAKEKGMGKELIIGFKDTSLSLSLNRFLLYHEFYFKELKLFLELYTSFVILVGNEMEFLGKLISLLYCREELRGLSPLKEIEHQSDLVTVDYGVNLQMSFDLIPLFIYYALRIGKMQQLEYFRYLYFNNHDAFATNRKKFGI